MVGQTDIREGVRDSCWNVIYMYTVNCRALQLEGHSQTFQWKGRVAGSGWLD